MAVSRQTLAVAAARAAAFQLAIDLNNGFADEAAITPVRDAIRTMASVLAEDPYGDRVATINAALYAFTTELREHRGVEGRADDETSHYRCEG